MPSVVGTRRKDGQGLTEAGSPRSRRHGAGSSGDSGCHRPWCRLPEEGRVSMHTDSLSPRRPQREQRLPRHLPPPPSPRRPPLPHADGSPGARSPEDSLGETPLTVCVCRGDARRGTGNRARAQAARLCGDRLPGRRTRPPGRVRQGPRPERACPPPGENQAAPRQWPPRRGHRAFPAGSG